MAARGSSCAIVVLSDETMLTGRCLCEAVDLTRHGKQDVRSVLRTGCAGLHLERQEDFIFFDSAANNSKTEKRMSCLFKENPERILCLVFYGVIQSSTGTLCRT